MSVLLSCPCHIINIGLILENEVMHYENNSLGATYVVFLVLSIEAGKL